MKAFLRRCIDILHNNINVKKSLVGTAVKIMYTCPLNSDYIPEDMKNGGRMVGKLVKEDAWKKWKENDLR